MPGCTERKCCSTGGVPLVAVLLHPPCLCGAANHVLFNLMQKYSRYCKQFTTSGS